MIMYYSFANKCMEPDICCIWCARRPRIWPAMALCNIVWRYNRRLHARIYLIGNWPHSKYRAGTGILAWTITRLRIKASSIFSKASTWLCEKLCQASLLNRIELRRRDFLRTSPEAILQRPSGASLTIARMSLTLPHPFDNLLAIFGLLLPVLLIKDWKRTRSLPPPVHFQPM